MSLALTITIEDEATPALRVIPGKITAATRKRLPTAATIVQRFWKMELSGPATSRRLGVGTGALRNSIIWKKSGPDAVVVGSPLRYAMAHEFGVRRTVGVRAHQRQPRNRVAHAVRAHTRQMNLPARPHRKPALKRATGPLTTLFRVGVAEALEEARKDGRRLGKAQKRLASRLGADARRTRG